MTPMENVDLIILGGGPAGYIAAERAASGGMKTALFEKKNLGGVCLNEGCIPTKTMIHSAKIVDAAVHGIHYGVKVDAPLSLDHADVIRRKDRVVKALIAGLRAKMNSKGIKVIPCAARLQGRGKSGFIAVSEEFECEAPRVLIATGSEAVIPPIEGMKEGIESGFVITSREALDLEEVPGELAIIGGGAIGLELAYYYNIAGSHVTVIEMLDQVGGKIDVEISRRLCSNLREQGIEFMLGREVTGIVPGRSVSFGGDEIKADKVLLSVGRKPSTSGSGLESIGIFIDKGAAVTDERLMTNVPNVYAAGDVNGKVMLAHTAYREAEVAVNNMLGGRDRMNYSSIPSVIYTAPEAAWLGETEASAAAKGVDAKTVKLSMNYAGRYLAENENGNGICKAVFAPDNRLLGVHMIGGNASETILSAYLMIESGLPVEILRRTVFPHPTTGEILREALFQE
jgi:dihydrolipoamide dehydrogenase